MAQPIQVTPTVEQIYKRIPPPPVVRLVGVDDAAVLCIIGLGICATIAICQVRGKPIQCNLNDFPKVGIRTNPKCLGTFLASMILAQKRRDADEAIAMEQDPAGGPARLLIIAAIWIQYAADVAAAEAAYKACQLAAAVGVDIG